MEFEGRALMSDMKKFFDFEQLTGNDDALSRWVVVPDINRPGLELTGYFEYTEPKRVVILGTKELTYIQLMSESDQRNVFDRLTDEYTPAIIISRQLECPPILYDISQSKNFPIFRTPLPTYRVMVDVISYLDEKLSPADNIHGVLMNVFGKGVLITGESGMGKSEIALELIRKGHILVADDRVDVVRIHNTIFGQAPELLRGMLEIRGIGIIDVTSMFGAAALLERTKVDFVVNLQKWDDKIEYDRLGIDDDGILNILDLTVPRLIFPVKEGRNMAVLVESAVIDFTLKQKGINSAKEFEKRVYDFIANQNK
ncbi:MAG: HPr(Ser) kinase/phosphatase [Erysipelotrichales bacterium]|nr:MAG: HPr(Ser) kinase/phosphatase [Erysipelotrichales bacterium]